MAETQYDIGDTVKVTGTFTVSDVNTDPTAVSATLMVPGGGKTTYVYEVDDELTKTATGIYKLTVDVTASGKHWVRFFSTGTAKAAGEHRFLVKERKVT